MNEPVRKELLTTLQELSAACPDLRFGQLVANLAYQATGHTNEAIWETADEELLTAAKRLLERRAAADAPVG
jgi:hypothetical protein